ncbi:MAG TPA: hypothetical protein CFH84_07870 [Sulfurimonas sp. UBA12504]|nr:MAG: hypothetical protein A2019_07680 [Sulfurimonas sp. GWF2_37_8]DAB29718.1 MAG TPA: hypothetical protein CFH84_07870 [Sulfurimonas sp. UBA12504]
MIILNRSKKIFLVLLLTFSELAFAIDSNSFLSEKDKYIISEISHNNSIKHKKGDFATAVLFNNKGDTQWATKFEIVQTGGLYDRDIDYNLLKSKGLLDIKHLVGYDWMPAFYYYKDGSSEDFVKWLHTNKNIATLNPNGPFTHCVRNNYDWCEDYYYNYFDEDVVNKRVDNLIINMKTKGFNGVFFDWGSAKFLLETENQEINQYTLAKYPEEKYLHTVENFYSKLKNNNVFIITNQAFRDDSLLSYANYDMTESYITTTQNIKINANIQGKGFVDNADITRYYPIYKDSSTIEDSLYFINILDDYKKKYKKDGFENFIYMNYIAPKYIKIKNTNTYLQVEPKNAIYYGYAMGKLSDSIVYAEVPQDRALERNEIYFYDLGSPLGEKYQKLDAINGYIRFYTNGFVLVSNAYNETKYINIISSLIPEDIQIFDAYQKEWVKSKDEGVVVKLIFEKEIFTDKALPLGRVFLYNR